MSLFGTFMFRFGLFLCFSVFKRFILVGANCGAFQTHALPEENIVGANV